VPPFILFQALVDAWTSIYVEMGLISYNKRKICNIRSPDTNLFGR
jgi:hypothetical protein